METISTIYQQIKDGTAIMPVEFKVLNAKKRILNGFKYFCGEHAQWLPEYQKVADWLEDTKGRGLFLIGSNGRGKSVIATKILPWFFKEQGFGYEIFLASEINQHKSEVMYPKILCIDDIGVEDTANDYGEKINVFAKVMDEVERKKKMIIITSNLTQIQLEKKYSTRTIDRINGCCKVVAFNGESLRGKFNI
ncbi:hypothetical protein [Prevotella sp. tc2-28]|uniref:nSTAND3 domain-containing NTPase n=1 Tax=Prevotella sp. tc2-28 TaxID=1761888 RepID=UPI000B873BB0|nr:hypothetical protein [Prevotella sp. tc2-28]